MSSAEVHQLSLGPLTGVAFGPDRSQVAVCPNSNEAQIYAKSGDSWELRQTLAEHDKLITAISWASQTNRIVTCSQDRNATIAVCSFDEENNWWVSKHVKKPLRSTVLSIDWHPNNVLLAAGAADAKAYVFSAFIKGVDSKPEPTVWGDRLPFGTICGEFSSPNGGWVHDVAFSPSGDILAYVSHDSAISIVYPSGPGAPPNAHISVRCPSLPYLSLIFTTESQIIAAGHDCQPIVFAGDSSGWSVSHSLDDPSASGAKALTSSTGSRSTSGGGPGRLNTEAFNLFKHADTRGSSGSGNSGITAVGQDGMLRTVHQNSITLVEPYEWTSSGEVAKVCSAGKDGRLVIWAVAGGKTSGLAGRMGGLQM
ncbi:MAG: hypothetical protein TREMPRED_004533 [Tremellales sp. Tagirdzhanova-0007]|nr:MAG: hypothetical protein TREMPRED_004533 [Tremellales sp. Tagirdzhanova-0007]